MQVRALGLLLMATIMFSIMSLLVKLGSRYQQFPASQLVFARSLVQAVVSCAYLLVAGKIQKYPAPVTAMLCLRGLAGALGTGLYMLSITVMSLNDATTLFFTGPPMTAVLARWWLHE